MTTQRPDTPIGRAMKQLSHAKKVRDREAPRWEYVNAQVDKWAAKAVEAGMPLRRVALFMGASHTTVVRAIERHYRRTVER